MRAIALDSNILKKGIRSNVKIPKITNVKHEITSISIVIFNHRVVAIMANFLDLKIRNMIY